MLKRFSAILFFAICFISISLTYGSDEVSYYFKKLERYSQLRFIFRLHEEVRKENPIKAQDALIHFLELCGTDEKNALIEYASLQEEFKNLTQLHVEFEKNLDLFFHVAHLARDGDRKTFEKILETVEPGEFKEKLLLCWAEFQQIQNEIKAQDQGSQDLISASFQKAYFKISDPWRSMYGTPESFFPLSRTSTSLSVWSIAVGSVSTSPVSLGAWLIGPTYTGITVIFAALLAGAPNVDHSLFGAPAPLDTLQYRFARNVCVMLPLAAFFTVGIEVLPAVFLPAGTGLMGAAAYDSFQNGRYAESVLSLVPATASGFATFRYFQLRWRSPLYVFSENLTVGAETYYYGNPEGLFTTSSVKSPWGESWNGSWLDSGPWDISVWKSPRPYFDGGYENTIRSDPYIVSGGSPSSTLPRVQEWGGIQNCHPELARGSIFIPYGFAQSNIQVLPEIIPTTETLVIPSLKLASGVQMGGKYRAFMQTAPAGAWVQDDRGEDQDNTGATLEEIFDDLVAKTHKNFILIIERDPQTGQARAFYFVDSDSDLLKIAQMDSRRFQILNYGSTIDKALASWDSNRTSNSTGFFGPVGPSVPSPEPISFERLKDELKKAISLKNPQAFRNILMRAEKGAILDLFKALKILDYETGMRALSYFEYASLPSELCVQMGYFLLSFWLTSKDFSHDQASLCAVAENLRRIHFTSVGDQEWTGTFDRLCKEFGFPDLFVTQLRMLMIADPLNVSAGRRLLEAEQVAQAQEAELNRLFEVKLKPQDAKALPTAAEASLGFEQPGEADELLNTLLSAGTEPIEDRLAALVVLLENYSHDPRVTLTVLRLIREDQRSIIVHKICSHPKVHELVVNNAEIIAELKRLMTFNRTAPVLIKGTSDDFLRMDSHYNDRVIALALKLLCKASFQSRDEDAIARAYEILEEETGRSSKLKRAALELLYVMGERGERLIRVLCEELNSTNEEVVKDYAAFLIGRLRESDESILRRVPVVTALIRAYSTNSPKEGQTTEGILFDNKTRELNKYLTHALGLQESDLEGYYLQLTPSSRRRVAEILLQRFLNDDEADALNCALSEWDEEGKRIKLREGGSFVENPKQSISGENEIELIVNSGLAGVVIK
ncbi:MAG: hypothetical protein HYS98_00240 [Deltaproteobacteria bacterium]|nr:hypothetical protein [Deltaproteobacteria bacterium]